MFENSSEELAYHKLLILYILEKIKMDTERDNFMSALEAKEYGLIDEVFTKRP